MTGTIRASCGHVLKDDEETVGVIYGGEDCDAVEGFVPCIHFASFCPACAEDAKAWPTWFPDVETAEAWLDAQPQPKD